MIQSQAEQRSESSNNPQIIELDSFLKHPIYNSDSAANQAFFYCFQSKCLKSEKSVTRLKQVYNYLLSWLYFFPLKILGANSVFLWFIMIESPYCWFPFNPLSLCGLFMFIITFISYIIASHKPKSVYIRTQNEIENNEFLYPGIIIPTYIAMITIFLLNFIDKIGHYKSSCDTMIKPILNNSFMNNSQFLYNITSALIIDNNSTFFPVPFNYTTMDLILKSINTTSSIDSSKKFPSLYNYVLFSFSLISVICMLLPLVFSIFAASITLRIHWLSWPRLYCASNSSSRWNSRCSSSSVCGILQCVWRALCVFAWPFVVRIYRVNKVSSRVPTPDIELESMRVGNHQEFAGRFILEFDTRTGATANADEKTNSSDSIHM